MRHLEAIILLQITNIVREIDEIILQVKISLPLTLTLRLQLKT